MNRVLFKHNKLYINSEDPTQLPLLSRQSIFDLYNRIQHRFRNRGNQYEVAHHVLGDNRSVYKGYGLDYEESRPYQAGDELRFMNWRVTARTGELYMKVYREERRPGVFVLVDRRASMRFGTRVRIKAAQAARAAALVSFIAQRENAQVGGVILQDEISWVPEHSGTHAAFNLVNQASKPCPPCMDKTEEPSLHYIFKVMTRVLTKGSTVYLISDFHDLTDACRAALLQLGREHQIVALHIVDRAEIDLPNAGELTLTPSPGMKAEANSEVNIHSEDILAHKTFNQRAAAYLGGKEQILVSTGIRYQRVMSDAENIEQKITV